MKRAHVSRRARCQGGWSMLESLLSIALLALVFPPTLAVLSGLQQQFMADRGLSEARDNARGAISSLSRLVRSAGNNPHGIPLQALRIDNAWTFAVESDLTGGPEALPDGDLDDSFERVTIQWDRAARQITLASGAGSRQPLARCITLLEVSGLDRNGQPTEAADEIVYLLIHIRSEAEIPDLRSRWGQAADWSVRVPLLSRLELTP